MSDLEKVSIINTVGVIYPESNCGFSPDENFPEYIYGTEELSPVANHVYRMVRETFFQFGLDTGNYGKSGWNPLGEYINAGDTVLIKPNWVMHVNKAYEGEAGLECLVTHPSVIRAVVDYVQIALKDRGRIVVADAPMQECDMKKLFDWTPYKKLFSFWQRKNINIEILDLRKYASAFKGGVVIEKKFTENTCGGIKVDVNDKSLHRRFDNNETQYKVSDYSSKVTNSYHKDGHHVYEINRCAIEADVIISMPKPKSHRLAGMTGAMKNFVGIVYEKACLPHRKLGGVKSGGDSYKKECFFKQKMQIFDERKTEAYMNNHLNAAAVYSLFEKAAYVLGTLISRDSIRVGSWYGNDTIWRTVADLNYILRYASKEGKLCETQQRRILCIGDLIVCGQHNGPVSPEPKKLGMIMLSENPYLFDTVMCSIMGFDWKRIGILSNEETMNNMGFESRRDMQNAKIIFNGNTFSLRELKCHKEWKFQAHDDWRGFIETDE